MKNNDKIYSQFRIKIAVPLCVKKYIDYKARGQHMRPAHLYSKLITNILSSNACREEMERLAKTSGDSEWLQSLEEYKRECAEKERTRQDQIKRGEKVIKPRRIEPEPQIVEHEEATDTQRVEPELPANRPTVHDYKAPSRVQIIIDP